MQETNASGIAELDQAMAASKSMAGFLAVYFRYLTEQGFTRPESIEIILGYQEWLLSQTKRPQP